MQSSPCTWGCFQGAWRRRNGTPGLPHARGGVSKLGIVSNAPLIVFPMHVGVFLKKKKELRYRLCLPHARGGVSQWL